MKQYEIRIAINFILMKNGFSSTEKNTQIISAKESAENPNQSRQKIKNE